MLFLSEKDILKGISKKEVLDAIEKAYMISESQNFQMPQRMHMDAGKNIYLLMPCFSETVFGTKLLTLFPDNSKMDLPVINALMVLNNIETGEPVAIMNGSTLTAIRTGAVGGVSIKHMTPNDITKIGLIGAGVQGFYQILFAAAVRDIKEVYVYDIKKEKALTLIRKLNKQLTDVVFKAVDNVQELLKNSQTVITTTTSLNPVLPNDENLLQGKHYVAVGSFKPNMRELPEALFKYIDKIFVDTEHAVHETGDIIYPIENNLISSHQIQTFGSFLIAGGSVKDFKTNTTLFKSVGMALFDLVVAEELYNSAVEKGVGVELEL